MEWVVNSSEPKYIYTTESDEVVREKDSATIIALVKTKANAQRISAIPDFLELARQIILQQEEFGDMPDDIVSGAQMALVKAGS